MGYYIELKAKPYAVNVEAMRHVGAARLTQTEQAERTGSLYLVLKDWMIRTSCEIVESPGEAVEKAAAAEMAGLLHASAWAFPADRQESIERQDARVPSE